MRKSMCCNADMIYLGKSNGNAPIHVMLGDTYIYCCSKCGSCEWSDVKEKTKYKWYKFDKERLKDLLNIRSVSDETNK